MERKRERQQLRMRVAASDDKHERCHCFESHGELAETRKIAKNLERKEKLALEAK
jgi:hypothetical protein